MKSSRSHSQLQSEVLNRIIDDASARSISVGRQEEKQSEGHCDDDLVYSKKELLEGLRQLEKDVKAGKYPVYDTADEMFKALDFELDHES